MDRTANIGFVLIGFCSNRLCNVPCELLISPLSLHYQGINNDVSDDDKFVS